MFLNSIKIVNVDLCVQEKDKYVAQTVASDDLSEMLPYLNSFVRRAVYNPNSDSLKFVHEKIEFTIIKEQVNIAKFRNRTELHELLDWFIELVNDTFESKDEIAPKYENREPAPVLKIYALLPKTNCQKCGEKSCMAFAAKLNKMELDLEDCEIIYEPQNSEKRQKLEELFA